MRVYGNVSYHFICLHFSLLKYIYILKFFLLPEYEELNLIISNTISTNPTPPQKRRRRNQSKGFPSSSSEHFLLCYCYIQFNFTLEGSFSFYRCWTCITCLEPPLRYWLRLGQWLPDQIYLTSIFVNFKLLDFFLTIL